jgi:hypothetical protein
MPALLRSSTLPLQPLVWAWWPGSPPNDARRTPPHATYAGVWWMPAARCGEVHRYALVRTEAHAVAMLRMIAEREFAADTPLCVLAFHSGDEDGARRVLEARARAQRGVLAADLDDVPSALTVMDQRPWHAASPRVTMSPQEPEETRP